MKSNEQLIIESYEFGKAAYGFKGCAPHENKEFMDTVPNCQFGDERGIALRIAMYHGYLTGWHKANSSQGMDDDIIEQIWKKDYRE